MHKKTTPKKSVIESILDASCHDIFAILGVHRVGSVYAVRVFQPYAIQVKLEVSAANKPIAMQQVDHSGLFVAELAQPPVAPYRLHCESKSNTWRCYDPYSFLPLLSDHDNYFLSTGQRNKNYQIFGANHTLHYGIKGVHFAVWAPNARRVSVVGNFNGWDGRLHMMRHHVGCGTWEIFIAELADGEYYKYEIMDRDGKLLPLKSDPYAFYAEKPPQTASIVWRKNNFEWRDQAWMEIRGGQQSSNSPISIYEVHLGSWRRPAAHPNSYLSYQELAHQLSAYVKQLGFTHVQLMPIAEYPFDGSWGYQPISLFAPSSRFGNPDDFKYFIDLLHQEGIGVLLDWVPAHFPSDPHGLAKFDGTHLYEHADPKQGFHQDWNTCIYNYSRTEICSFLIDNACYWLDEFHIDGLRVDAVASMLYLDYSRAPGEWIPNRHGGNQNLEAVDLLQRLNETVYAAFPGIITIAEESTSWPGVTHQTSAGGLGFGYKWNMGWMNDSLNYMSQESIHRKHHHNNITFGLLYAFSENFILPLSHDEVVHGKGSLLNKMSGDEWQRFANLRAYYAFMWTHPGKKLLFMGGEFAQLSEWNHDSSLEWDLLKQNNHLGIQRLITALNSIYRNSAALHHNDSNADSFSWLDVDNEQESIFAYARFAPSSAVLIVVCNFTPVVRAQYRVGVPRVGEYDEILNTDSEIYGGGNVGNLGAISSQNVPSNTHQNSLLLTLPPLSVCIFEHRP